ncbi:MAG: hypothetical protein HQM10_20050 [Candidatus Riflebacteria bacterium]|nr:hypothetical protein [Candidatus Riflebacteria bacterium]
MERMKCIFGISVFFCLFAFAGVAFAGEIKLPEKLTDVVTNLCPVTGEFSHEEFAAIHKGKVYHFSCATASFEFRKSPDVYIAKLINPQESELTVKNPDAICPVTKKSVNPGLFNVCGKYITFYCSSKCSHKDFPGKSADLPQTKLASEAVYVPENGQKTPEKK